MNCPQCQEQLDERLDEMRPALRSGALTSDAARAQARTAFDTLVSSCPECETELRAYLQLRLSLMTPDAEMAAVAVPPNIRVNVRRALEREHLPLPPLRPIRNPLKGFAWTGGAIVSAIALFVIARPFLFESARQPLPTFSSNPASAPQVGQGASSTRVAPPTGAPGQAPRLPSRTSKSAPKPKGVGSAAPSTADSSSSFLEMSPPKITSSAAPSKRNRSAPRSVSSGSRESKSSKLSPPEMRMMQKPNSQEPPVPVVGSPGPGFGGPGQVGPSLPAEPRLDPKLLAPSGEELGLSVRFVPSAPTGAIRPQVRSMAPPRVQSPAFRSGPKPPTELPANPEALTPPTLSKSPPQSSDATGEKSHGGAGGTAGSAGPAAPMPATSPVTQGSLSVSVKKTVVNARVVGQIKGAAPDEKILWSGKASAGQSIPVPLEPLGAVKGDTVVVSFQQQVSLGETKTLATESVVVP